jgi:hypothetical protein
MTLLQETLQYMMILYVDISAETSRKRITLT